MFLQRLYKGRTVPIWRCLCVKRYFHWDVWARRERERQLADQKAGNLEMGTNGDSIGPDPAKPTDTKADNFGPRHDHMPGYHAPHEDMRMVDTPYAHTPKV